MERSEILKVQMKSNFESTHLTSILCACWLALVVSGTLFGEGPFNVRYKGLRIALDEPYRLSQEGAIGTTGPYANGWKCSFYVERTNATAGAPRGLEAFHEKNLNRLAKRMENVFVKTKMKTRKFGDGTCLYSELVEQGPDMIAGQHYFTLEYEDYYYSVLFNALRGGERVCAKTVEEIAFFYESNVRANKSSAR